MHWDVYEELNRAMEEYMGRVQYILIKGHQGKSLGLKSEKYKHDN